MTTTLTDRYIAQAVRSLPPSTQDDVRAELEASIADDIDARLEQGQAHDEAEREVLTALGDPDVLAAGYADRPLHLIGPKYYLTWWRLLKLLLWIVPVCAVGGVILGMSIANEPIAEIIGTAWAVLIGSIVHVAFWTTLVFFILERSGADTGVKWSLDSLPETPDSGAGRGDLIASLVFLGISAAVILWDRFVGIAFFAQGGVNVSVGLDSQTSAVQILHPDLWPWWTGALLVIIGLEAALAIAVYARRGWSVGFAAWNTVLAVVVASGAVYLLATGQLVNPAFIDLTVGRPDIAPDVVRIIAIILGAVIIGIAVWDIIDGWRKAARARRGVA